MFRSYSVLTLKSIDDAERVFEGVASTPTPDRAQDVVNPLGARYKLPLPLLYQHASDKPVGEVFAATPTPSGITVRARVFKATESRTLRERLDECWESIKIGALRGLSVGFVPLDPPELLDSGGLMFNAYEWIELSVCSIPMNAEANITNVKSHFAAARRKGHVVVRLDAATLRRARG